MTKEDVRQYQRDNPVYYPIVPTLRTKCPVNYDWDNCSSKEFTEKEIKNYVILVIYYFICCRNYFIQSI